MCFFVFCPLGIHLIEFFIDGEENGMVGQFKKIRKTLAQMNHKRLLIGRFDAETADLSRCPGICVNVKKSS